MWNSVCEKDWFVYVWLYYLYVLEFKTKQKTRKIACEQNDVSDWGDDGPR